MEKKKVNKDNYLLNVMETIQDENLRLQHCLKKIVVTKTSIEAELDKVEKQLLSLVKDEDELHTINAKYAFKIKVTEEGANQLEEQQNSLTERVKSLDSKLNRKKEVADIAINKLAKEAENLCELFLSAVHNETAESDFLKISEEMKKLHEDIAEKENAIMEIKKELDEFVFYESPKDMVEQSVPMEERQLLMNWMEDQLLDAKGRLEELNLIKSEKEMEECD